MPLVLKFRRAAVATGVFSWPKNRVISQGHSHCHPVARTIDSAPYSVTDTFKLVDHQKVLETLASSLLQNLVDDLRAQNLDVKSHLVWGNPNREILDKAQSEKVDLIVMGTHGRTGLPHVIMGSVAEKTIRLSPVPVLTVPLSTVATTTSPAS